jgi:hypothetical protein
MLMLTIGLATFYSMVLFDILMLYVVAGVVGYLYTVFKNFEVTGLWCFKIESEHIGICRYPKWLLGWVHWLAVKFRWA